MKGVKGQDSTTAEQTRLITDSYRAANRLMHDVGFGKGGYQWAASACGLIMMTRAAKTFSIKSVLDYGCGQGTLHWVLIDLLHQHGLVGQVTVEGYEPCSSNPLLVKPPEPADLVMCTDVLEHIEPDLLDNVLKHLVSLIQIYGFFSICLHKSGQVLPNGMNSHRIVESAGWWKNELLKRFTNHDILEIPIAKPGEHYVVLISVKQDHTQRKMCKPLVSPNQSGVKA